VNGAEAIIRLLEEEGVEYIFGIPGGSITKIYDVLYDRSKIKHVLVRHEEAASFMVDAYARVTGKPSVCLAHVSAGAANLVIGVAAAYLDSIPMIALTGQVRTQYSGRGAQMEFDNVQLFQPITKWSVKVPSADKIPEIFRTAFRIIGSARPGPVHINIPVDIQEDELYFDERYQKSVGSIGVMEGDPRLIRDAAELLTTAEKPLIWAGGGVIASGASGQVQRLADILNCPVATSYNGRGSIPENHVLSLGRTGQYTPSFVHDFVADADVILAVGFRFTDVSTNDWTIPKTSTKLIQIDVDSLEIGRNFPVELGIIGDAHSVLNNLIHEIKTSLNLKTKANYRAEWANYLQKLKIEWNQTIKQKLNSNDIPIKPQRVMKELRLALKEDAIVTAAAGFCKDWASTMFEIYKPRTWIHPAGLTPMGYALCAAIGAKIAKPEREVVAITGDGAFQMVCQELITAVENDASILICLLNDGSYGMIRYLQKKRHGGRFIATEFARSPDFVKLAEALGAQGKRVEKPNDLKLAIQNGLTSDKPYLLDIIIDKDEIPGMI
jgi:acetolactate synthase-1/2/3 large subunit